jgi:hypothetical protein
LLKRFQLLLYFLGFLGYLSRFSFLFGDLLQQRYNFVATIFFAIRYLIILQCLRKVNMVTLSAQTRQKKKKAVCTRQERQHLLEKPHIDEKEDQYDGKDRYNNDPLPPGTNHCPQREQPKKKKKVGRVTRESRWIGHRETAKDVNEVST